MTTATTTRPFHLWLAVTGALSRAIIETIKVPHRVVPIVYEKEMPLPRLWHDKSQPEGSQWKPVSHGSSIFDNSKGWTLEKLRSWCRSRARSHLAQGGGPLIIDIEDVPPLFDQLKRDRPENLAQMRYDIAHNYSTTAAEPLVTNAMADDMITFALRQLWSTIIDTFAAEGVDVSIYGHTPDLPHADSYYDHPTIRDLYRGWSVVSIQTRRIAGNVDLGKSAATDAPEILLINGKPR